MAIRRYPYSMHHVWVTAGEMGKLYPCFVQEVTPGDTWQGRSMLLTRMAPIVRPAYVTLQINVHYFFVPHRLIWDEFEDVITGVSASTPPTLPAPDEAGQLLDAGRLYQYMGIGPADTGNTKNVYALPFYAYNLVWNEFFRDQAESTERLETDTTIAPVFHSTNSYIGGARSEIQQGTEQTVPVVANAVSVTDIRDAFHRQKFQERRSQFGERYHDYLAAMGVRVPDSRLDRPEHVARGRGILGVSEVVATSETANQKTGDFTGHGIAGTNIRMPKRNFVEHGILLGLVSVKSRLQLRERIDRMWKTKGREDYFQQELSRDTMVEIDLTEVTSSTTQPFPTIFGYTGRDEWLRTANDTCAGPMQEAAQREWNAFIAYTGDPSLHSVQLENHHPNLFQDQTADAIQFYWFFDHRIGKRSMVAPRQR